MLALVMISVSLCCDGWKRDLADAAREEARLGQWNSLTLSWALAVVLLSAGAMLMYLYLRG